MTTLDEPRGVTQRVRDARDRLQRDEDLWIATAHGDVPWLVPLSFHWTGTVLLMATLRRSRTFRNVADGGGARVVLGHTRDVVVLDGDIDRPDELAQDEANAVAAATGYDPRTDANVAYLRFTPSRVQAWRTVAEIEGRTIMTGGRWHAGDA